MMDAADFARFSRRAVMPTVRELDRDIEAQLRALMDEDHPKKAVFLAAGTELKWGLPVWVFVERREEGTLITVSAELAYIFKTMPKVTDGALAAMLGYPEAKADVLDSGGGAVVQARDRDGNVIWEAFASYARMQLSIDAAARQVPAGGDVHVTTAELALQRRFSGMMN
ncbi:hypothetical protein [uncultured Devosia sp.]|mgnify:CR=1 FL=1|uniref:hypothetical protein n=1 Tax=uncultured Devosia sp. TaxID=211434 RepID=UPI002608AE6A|nr:hypothetical protein [uncultured Devosia sp.]